MKTASWLLVFLLAVITPAIAEQRWVVQPEIIHPMMTSTSSIRIGSRIRTYFMQRNGIFFAESDDGRSLSRTTTTNVRGTLQEGDAEASVSNPTVVAREDGKFVMVYDASPEIRPPFLPRRLFVRLSDNGIAFGPSAPLPVTSLDRHPRGRIFQSVPDLVRMADGSLRLYYTAGGTAIGSMRSADGGQSWTPDAGYRLGESQPGPPRAAYVDPDVVLQSDGAVIMYFTYSEFEPRCGGLGCQIIRLAISKDGLSFTLEPGVLVDPTGNASRVVDPDVFQTADGRWQMLYGEEAGRTVRLRLAIRAD